jgi:type VI secretion system protein ImpM
MGEFRPAMTGFFGKLPARGDFVRANLPEDFVAPLDAWCRECLSASRQTLGDGWEEAWMSAPIWRFLLPPGACGPHAVFAIWLPSIDKVGRHYPFMLCALAPAASDLAAGGNWAEAAEAAGLAAVVEDLPHTDITAMLQRPVPDSDAQIPGWWTAGSPFVKPRRFDISGLLPANFAGAMLRDSEPAEP